MRPRIWPHPLPGPPQMTEIRLTERLHLRLTLRDEVQHPSHPHVDANASTNASIPPTSASLCSASPPWKSPDHPIHHQLSSEPIPKLPANSCGRRSGSSHSARESLMLMETRSMETASRIHGVVEEFWAHMHRH